ncbi:MAG TPA: hypothetical protein VFK48_12405 [Usitatibacter sp.]|nr:hypothetical protein [Usitatibacter sp.]
MDFVSEHAVRSHTIVVPLPMAEAFRLFEPEGERAWAEGWEPRYRHPPDGHAERGMVFTTGHGGEETIWTMIRHEPEAGVVEYVRTTPGSRTATVLVQCLQFNERLTRVTVIYAMTGLTEAGNAAIRELDENEFRRYIESWESAIAKALAKR